MANVAHFPVPGGLGRESTASPHDDERRLLAAIRGGDRSAAEELVDKTYSAVYASLCRMTADPDLAADLTQETYQKAWTALGKFDGRSQLFTWLYRIAYTTFLNHIRRPSRTTSLDVPEAPDPPDHSPAIDERIAETEEAERLRAAVNALPDDLRFTISAHFWGGLAVKEIAAEEGITTVAIRKRLHKAFTLLEVALEKDVR